MTTPPNPTIWPSIRYADAPAAIDFLVDAFGFYAAFVVKGEGPGSRPIEHAQLHWPFGGGVMLGSIDTSDRAYAKATAGTGVASCYVVCEDADSVNARAIAGGAQIIEPIHDDPYGPEGSRSFTALDPEGNVWTFGTYRGE